MGIPEMSMFVLLLLILHSWEESTTEAKVDTTPYKFGFRTTTQHRREEKMPDGTIRGEYGHATANGYYLTTVYATDARGKFLILEQRKEKIEDTREPRQARVLKEDPPAEGYFFNYTSTNERVTKLHHHEEHGFKDGSKNGSYWWDAPDGIRHQVTYTANGKRGFKPIHTRIRLHNANHV